jgi:signal transduction histidine kinase
MKNISISEKLILYFVSLGVAVILIVGSLSYYFAKKALLNRTFDQLISLRLEKKNRIEQFFLDRERDINLISKSEEINKIIKTSFFRNGYPNQPQLQPNSSYLTSYISSYGYYQKLYIAHHDSIIFCLNADHVDLPNNHKNDSSSVVNLLNFSKQIEIAGKTIIQDLTKSRLLIYIGSPVYNSQTELMGTVVLEIPIQAINKIMFGYTDNGGLGKSGETYLVGNDYLMRSNSRFRENAVLNLKVETTAVINAFKGETGTGIIKDYRNISCLSSYSKVNIEGLDWVILAEIDEREAMVPVNAIRNSILLVSIMIGAIVFIIALLVSRRITLPLKKLQKATEQIRSGIYGGKLQVSSLDEIGMLTMTFNDMTSHLKKQSEELELEKTKRVSLLIDGQEMERQRLSRDLHDGLGQSLLAIKIKLEQAKNANSTKNQQIINETQELLKNAIQEIRNISGNLMPPVLEAFGIEQGLKNLCKYTEANTGIKIKFTSENLPGAIDQKIQIYLYRISQEAINNITKHADASKAAIRISSCSNCISLNIADNGKGFEITNSNSKGNGLMNIKERVQLLGGECHVYSSPGKGTSINIEIPVLPI